MNAPSDLEAFYRRRRSRGRALAFILVCLAVLMFLITLVRTRMAEERVHFQSQAPAQLIMLAENVKGRIPWRV